MKENEDEYIAVVWSIRLMTLMHFVEIHAWITPSWLW